MNNQYKLTFTGNRRGRYEHRMIMETYLKRKLSFNEDVHHLNGNKKDNRIENLIVLTKSEHGKYHSDKYYAIHRYTALPKKCELCGNEYSYKSKMGKKAFEKMRFCSISCCIKNARSNSSCWQRRADKPRVFAGN